jgi:DNA replication protein DnaC
LTTNLEFSRWVTIFYDEQMTTAMIDRLVHFSHLLVFDGESWRMKNSLIRQ